MQICTQSFFLNFDVNVFQAISSSQIVFNRNGLLKFLTFENLDHLISIMVSATFSRAPLLLMFT